MLETMDISNLTSEEKELYNIAKAWQYNNDMEEIGPSIWSAWYGILYDLVWDEFDVKDTAIDAPFTYQTIYLIEK